MNVKGIVFLTGKSTITAAFGEQRWNAFLTKLAAKDNFFNNMIMSITPIPVDKYLLFLEELIQEYFEGDKNNYFFFGKVAANFALSPGGPYYTYLLSKDINQFVKFVIPKLWSTYYDKGNLTGYMENNVLHIKITGIPIKHIYFEYLNAGYFQHALKIFGKKAVEKCIRGFSKGDDDIYYQYELNDY